MTKWLNSAERTSLNIGHCGRNTTQFRKHPMNRKSHQNCVLRQFCVLKIGRVSKQLDDVIKQIFANMWSKLLLKTSCFAGFFNSGAFEFFSKAGVDILLHAESTVSNTTSCMNGTKSVLPGKQLDVRTIPALYSQCQCYRSMHRLFLCKLIALVHSVHKNMKLI